MLISIVIPIYNSALTLPVLVARVTASAEGLPADTEIVLVNDASTDDSLRVMQALRGTYPQLRVFSLAYNAGQHAAALIGMRAAKGDLIITLDDDLQHPPEAFAAMLAALTDDTDVVYAHADSPYHGRGSYWLSLIAKCVLRHGVGMRNALHMSPFRLMRKKLVTHFNGITGTACAIDGLIARAGCKTHAISIRYGTREHGISSYNFIRSFRLFLLMAQCSRVREWNGLTGGKPLPSCTALP